MKLTSVQRRLINEAGEGTRRERDRLSGRGNEDHREAERQWKEAPNPETWQRYQRTHQRRGVNLVKITTEVWVPQRVVELGQQQLRIRHQVLPELADMAGFEYDGRFSPIGQPNLKMPINRRGYHMILTTIHNGVPVEIVMGDTHAIWGQHQRTDLARDWFQTTYNQSIESEYKPVPMPILKVEIRRANEA